MHQHIDRRRVILHVLRPQHFEAAQMRAEQNATVVRSHGSMRSLIHLHMHVEIAIRSEEHTSELKSLMRISYPVFCLENKTTTLSTLTQHTLSPNPNEDN